MRTVSSQWLDNIGTSRQIKARATFRDTRLIFATFTPTESTKPTVSDIDKTDSSLTRSGFLRIAVDDSLNLWYQYVPDPTLGTWPNWVDSGINVPANCYPGVKGDRIWYTQGGFGSTTVYYVDFNGTNLDTPVNTSLLVFDRVALAPVSTTECYVYGRLSTNLENDDVYQYGMYRIELPSTRVIFYGAIYADLTNPNRFDAVRVGNIDHLYYLDDSQGRSKVLEVNDTIWGAEQAIVPLDVLDTENFFTLGAATTINSRVFVTGRLRRDQNIEMDIYSMGPTHYTMGREMFIVSDAEFTTDTRAKLMLVGATLYYIGFDFKAKAPATNLVGVDVASLKTQSEDIYNFNVDFSANRTSAIDFGVKSDLVHAAIRRGSEFDIELGVATGDDIYEWATLAKFGIDGFAQDTYDDGAEQKLIGRSLGMKRLSQWSSDAYYDYWSQAKHVADPALLDKMVITSGQWDVDETQDEQPLVVTDLNEDHIMYGTAKSSRNSVVKAKFKKNSIDNDYNAEMGLFLNYYKETRAEAGERLGIDADDVSDDQFGHYGLKVVYRERADIGPWIWLEVVRADQTMWMVPPWVDPRVWIEDDRWFWLRAQFFEGYLSIHWRYDDETDWTSVYNVIYNINFYAYYDGWRAGAEPPWYSEERGRGAVIVKNTTEYSDTPGFTSTSDIIPVEDITPFPTSETVEVDNEQIVYSGTATSANVPSEMTWAEGHTYPQADHANTNWDNILWRTHEWNPLASGEMEFGRYSNVVAYILQFMRSPHGYQRVDKIRIPIKKIGSPTNNVYCYIVNDNIDNGGSTISNASIFMEASVTPAAVGADYAWIEFDFLGSGTLRNGKADYYLDPTYKKSYGIFVTTVPFAQVDSTPGAAYFDPNNYYVVDMDETLGGALGQTEGTWLLWNTSTSWDRYYLSYGPDDAIMPFEILGKSPTSINGYEIYIETADSPATLAEDEFTDMALVCTEGPGAGLTHKILYYDAAAPKQWVPNRVYDPPEKPEDYVGNGVHGTWKDQDLRRIIVTDRPSAFGEGSKFEIMPSLLVTERGANSTTITSHAAGRVSIYRDVKISVDQFEYYSGEMDMRLEDMAFELVRKAGIYDFACGKDMSGNQVFSGSGWRPPVWLSRRNFIAKFEVPTMDATEEAGVIFRTTTNPTDITTVTQGYIVTLTQDNFIKFYKFESSTWTLKEKYPVSGFTPTGTVTISAQGDVFSVWIAGRQVTSFFDDAYPDGNYAGLLAYGTVTINADWSELDILTDNFVLDMGRRGQQLLDGLIGPKRIFYLDDQSGGIRMGRMRTTGAADFTVTDLTIERAGTVFDASQMTRIRAEGAEIAEIVDYTELRNEGNLFAMINATEANDYWETYEEAQRILAEAKSTQSVISPTLFVDPRVEPEDIITLGSDTILVDRVLIRLMVSKDKAELTMDIAGREV
jgi:hypothetical protein